MRRAIALASSQVGRTGANPAVGCLIVREGSIVGEAATADGGRPHAEEQAIDQAGPSAERADVYLTLEPCDRRSTGGIACAERLATAKVARVFIACADPSPFASGRGVERLRGLGVVVITDVASGEAAHLYGSYRPSTGQAPESRS